MATGVSQASMFVCSEVAPVMNGDVCASADSGTKYQQAISRTNNAERG
jgi:hypothetical protein